MTDNEIKQAALEEAADIVDPKDCEPIETDIRRVLAKIIRKRAKEYE